jgi:ACT domain-containing protein
MKRSGPKHTPGELLLLQQVAEVFTAQRERKNGAKEAVKELGISRASFYKYARGEDLPRVEVLKAVEEKWERVKWKLLDLSQMTEKQKVASPEQYVLSFLQEVRSDDVQIKKIGPKGERTLQVTLNIRFPG